MKTRPAARRLFASLVGSAVLCAAVAAAWYCWPQSLPTQEAPPSVLAKFASTDRFNELSIDDQQPYAQKLEKMSLLALIKAADDAGMSQSERMTAVRNVMVSRQEKVIGDYFKIPPAQRSAYMDKVIDDIEHAPIRPPGTERRPVPLTAQQQKQRSDNVAPVKQMQLVEFYGDLLARRAARGMPNAVAPPKH